MTDPEDKFSEKHTGKAFGVFDEEICGLNCISAVGRPPVSTRWAFLVVLPVRSCGWVSCGPMQPMGAGGMAIEH